MKAPRMIRHPRGSAVARVYVYAAPLGGPGLCAAAFVGTRSKRPQWHLYFPDERSLGRAVARLFGGAPRGKTPRVRAPREVVG